MLGSAAYAPTIEAAPALPTCGALAAYPSAGLVGNPNVVQSTITAQIIPAVAAVAASSSDLTPIPATPAYCQINFTYSSLSGPAAGYDVGQTQMIQIRISLPLSAADGGSGGVQGNWNGKTMTSASPGSSGSVSIWAN